MLVSFASLTEISEIYLYCHSSPSVSAAGSKGGTPIGSQLELSWMS